MLGIRRSTPNNQRYAYVVGRLVVFKYHYASVVVLLVVFKYHYAYVLGPQPTDVFKEQSGSGPGIVNNIALAKIYLHRQLQLLVWSIADFEVLKYGISNVGAFHHN